MENNLQKTILIIEDNPGDQLLLQENLLSTDLLIAEIVMADTLTEGIKCLGKKDFSLIFLDLFLPDSAGLDSFKELIKLNPAIPVIIYSGLSDTKIALLAITLGAQDFMIKGDYTISLLEKTVRYSIERKKNLDALQQVNHRYNLISKATNDMVWDWDLITGEVYRNVEGWKKIFRTKEGKEVGTSEDWPSKIHPGDQERVRQGMNDILRSTTQDFFEIECRILRDDDTIGYIEDRGFISRDGNGKPVRLIGAAQDISERKIAEQKVAMSEQRFKSLVQNGADLLCTLDIEGNYTYVSPTSKAILGYEPEFLVGKNALNFIHEGDIAITSESLAKIATEKFVTVPTFRFKNSLGDWRWVESTITNLMDDPAVAGIVVNSRDVTEKKLAEDELKKLSLIAKETINGVIISDKNQKILWVNNAFTKLSGYTHEEVIGKCPLDFLQGPDTDITVLNLVKEKSAKKLPFVFEMLHYTKTGSKLFVRVQVQPLFDEYGNVKQFFALQTDITKERALEEKVELEKQIKQKQITEAVFAAQESERSEIGREMHDNVNQLLGATRLYIDMAKTNAEERDALLTSASTYTLTAIEEIRKLSKTLITPLIKEVGLSDSVKDLAEEIMLVHPIRIRFTCENIDEKALTDKLKLNVYRIIQEQINNTLKHAKAKTIDIIIQQCDEKLSVSIADDGIGFDTSKRKNGVGITNIKSRSELFNGIVLLASIEGKGTTLSITFDLADLISKEQTYSAA